jgi:predicted ATP-grasp superfamily ATP-dependent carboligase
LKSKLSNTAAVALRILLSVVAMVLPARASMAARVRREPVSESRSTHLRTSAAPLRRKRPASATRPPALLTMPGYHGTLAAVRNLGRHGVPVTTADPARFTRAGWSKYTTESVRCPAVRDTERFVDWLLTFGREREPHVLLPTCDDTAFLYSLHREQLSEYFYLAVPKVEVLHGLLNKRLLMERAREVGLLTPQSWTPSGSEEVARLAREARFPLLIKPTTQVLFDPRSKGVMVSEREQFVQTYERLARDRYGRALRDYDASVTTPLVQEFFAEAASAGVYSICGHARDGCVVAARSARKVLQWPRRLGIGVCFEAAPMQPELLVALGRLIAHVGFSGTFEAEFVQDAGRHLLIDFNPRFYSQMGFDVARGLPLPLMAYEDALGGPLTTPPAPGNGADSRINAYAHGAAFKLLLHAQGASGALGKDEQRKWLAWYEEHRSSRVDAVADADDRAPELIDVMNIARDVARHPLRFLNVIALNRS